MTAIITPTTGYVVVLVFKGGATVRLEPVYVQREVAQDRVTGIQAVVIANRIETLLGIVDVQVGVVEIVP